MTFRDKIVVLLQVHHRRLFLFQPSAMIQTTLELTAALRRNLAISSNPAKIPENVLAFLIAYTGIPVRVNLITLATIANLISNSVNRTVVCTKVAVYFSHTK